MTTEFHLIDTNHFIRFLTQDDEEGYRKSRELFGRIEEGKIEGLVPDFILAEVVYVLQRIYGVERGEIAKVLQRLLLLEHLRSDNTIVSFEALKLYAERKIDFADALLCAQGKIYGYPIESLDKDLRKCMKSR